MSIKRATFSPPGWAFWLRWLFFSGLCWLAGLRILVAFMTIFSEDAPSIFAVIITLLISGLSTSILVGVVQWLLIRRRVDRAVRWIWSTMLGLSSGMLAGFLGTLLIAAAASIMFGMELGVTSGLTVMGAITGGLTGLTQWRFVLRQQFKPSGWILINIVNLALVGYVFGSKIGYIRNSALVAETVANITFYLPFTIAAVTGVALIWLLRRSHTLETEPSV